MQKECFLFCGPTNKRGAGVYIVTTSHPSSGSHNIYPLNTPYKPPEPLRKIHFFFFKGRKVQKKYEPLKSGGGGSTSTLVVQPQKSVIIKLNAIIFEAA